MNDIVNAQTRSRMMSAIRGKNTKPELLIRKALHSYGFRFRLHRKDLPGSPDLVLPRYRAVIQVNGCFWHGHACHLFKWPKTRREFWEHKLYGNIQRDKRNTDSIRKLGWRICTIWECEIKGAGEESLRATVDKLATWIQGNSQMISLPHSQTQILPD